MALAEVNLSRPDPPAAAYRRHARRLRSELRHQPGQLYLALNHLSRQHDALSKLKVQLGEAATQSRQIRAAGALSNRCEQSTGAASSPAASRFAQAIVNELQGGLLTFTSRSRLVRLAERMGLDRFEANLLIAAVLHRQSSAEALPQPSHGKSAAASAMGWALLIAVGLELGIAAVCYLTLA